MLSTRAWLYQKSSFFQQEGMQPTDAHSVPAPTAACFEFQKEILRNCLTPFLFERCRFRIWSHWPSASCRILKASFFFCFFELLLLVAFAASSRSASFFFDAFLHLLAVLFWSLLLLLLFSLSLVQSINQTIGGLSNWLALARQNDSTRPFSIALLHLFHRLGCVFSCRGNDAAIQQGKW